MAGRTEPYLSHPAGQDLLVIARRSLTCFLLDQEHFLPDLDTCMPELRQLGASFVTLTNQGELRGCIGMIEAKRPLAMDVAENSIAAASRDFRFSPLQPAELQPVRLSITVLTPPETLEYHDFDELLDQLRPGADGVILSMGERRGILLPQVWTRIPDPADFLDSICHKAGIPPELLRHTTPLVQVQIFAAQHFYEPGYLEPGGQPPHHA